MAHFSTVLRKIRKLQMGLTDIFSTVKSILYHVYRAIVGIKDTITKEEMLRYELLFYRTIFVGYVLYGWVTTHTSWSLDPIFKVIDVLYYFYVAKLVIYVVYTARKTYLLEKAEKEHQAQLPTSVEEGKQDKDKPEQTQLPSSVEDSNQVKDDKDSKDVKSLVY
jgi:hypothetical protein